MNREPIIFVIGCGVGAVAGVAAYSTMTKKKNEEKVNEAIAKVLNAKPVEVKKEKVAPEPVVEQVEPEGKVAQAISHRELVSNDKNYELEASKYQAASAKKEDESMQAVEPAFEYMDVNDPQCDWGERSMPITFTLYSDGVLVDEDDQPIDNDTEILGEGYFDHFGEFSEDNALYVRNNILKTDYEVLRDISTYEESVGAN